MKPKKKRIGRIEKMNARRLIVVALLATSCQVIPLSAHAADCKSDTCTALNSKERESTAMTTAGQAAPSNQAGQKGSIKNNYSESNSGKNAKNYTHSTTITCVRGHEEFHLNTKSTKCPKGFIKKK